MSYATILKGWTGYTELDRKNKVCTIKEKHTGVHKTAALVKEAIYQIPFSLATVPLFHTDRGRGFGNQEVDEILVAFGIQRSLSDKGCPYDNAVAESTYKSFKKKFVYPNQFQPLEQLKVQLFDYVNW